MGVNLDGEETSSDKVERALKEKSWMESLLTRTKQEQRSSVDHNKTATATATACGNFDGEGQDMSKKRSGCHLWIKRKVNMRAC